GQSIRTPKMNRSPAATVRSLSGSIPTIRVIALKTIATIVKDATKPSAMKTGRALLVRPMEAPKRTGRTGNVQGAAIVRMPARRANRRVSIGPPVNSGTGPEPRHQLGGFDSLFRVTTPIHYTA